MALSNANINKMIRCFVLIYLIIKICLCQDLPPVCPSDIYCYGPLLETVQLAKIYKDSKTFVDMKMKYPPAETMKKFNSFMDQSGKKPKTGEVRKFVEEHFEPAGQEFEKWDPKDWIPRPKYADKIKDAELKNWAIDLNSRWKILGRKMKAAVKENQELYSIIWVPNPVIVPGGRFREFYYWDSYWVIQGLLHSEMYSTVRGMLQNFVYIVDKYGSIPNGGRVYYIARSQPPLFIPMVKLYMDATNDDNFIYQNIHTLEKEFEYWMTEHSIKVTIKGQAYTLARYGDKTRGPRPESFSEDIHSARAFQTESQKEAFYSEIKAAAESGWDFSSRWFIKGVTNKGNLTDLQTRSIIPVDLNAILYWNAVLLAEFNSRLGNYGKAKHYRQLAEKWMTAVTAVLWHENSGAWLDYDTINNRERNFFYPSNLSPLWTGCYDVKNTNVIVRRVIYYLQSQNVLYPGGIPTSIEETGEQWDYPNAWPPLQHMIIIGLRNTGHDSAVQLAFKLARRWVYSNFKGFEIKSTMYEKYDVEAPGIYGGGGEYEIQVGFGWTNGVIMDLLSIYSDQLTAHTHKRAGAATSLSGYSSMFLTVVAIILLLVL